jgi:hypothetical protein
MSNGAEVGSIDAVRQFRAALVTFAEEAREALGSYEMEVGRALQWLLESQPQYWKQQVRICEDRVTEAKIELERCRASKLPGGETPSCMEEKKSLERARQRWQYVQDKIAATRKWGYVAQREESEYSGRASQLSTLFDAEVPRALAMLERALASLEAYTRVRSDAFGPLPAARLPTAGDPPPVSSGEPGAAAADDPRHPRSNER